MSGGHQAVQVIETHHNGDQDMGWVCNVLVGAWVSCESSF